MVSAATVPRTRADSSAVRISRRRFTIDDYHRMGEAGVPMEHDRVALRAGDIVALSPIRPPHASTGARSNALSRPRRRTRFRVAGLLG